MSDCLGNRNGISGPFGKLSEPLNLMLSEQTKTGLLMLAKLAGDPDERGDVHGVTVSEYVRDLLDEHVHGRLRLMRGSSPKHRLSSIPRTQQEPQE